MTTRRAGVTALLLACAHLSACAGSEAPAPPQERDRALQRAIQEPIDTARAVEGELQKQQEAMRRQMDAAER